MSNKFLAPFYFSLITRYLYRNLHTQMETSPFAEHGFEPETFVHHPLILKAVIGSLTPLTVKGGKASASISPESF